MANGSPAVDVKALYMGDKARKHTLLISLATVLFVSSIISICVGSVMVHPGDVLSSIGNCLFPSLVPQPDWSTHAIVCKIRAPRILLAVLGGIALGVSGTVMQSLLKNPLVSPFTLGLSSAAGFGAAASIVVGPIIFGSFFHSYIHLGIGTFYFSSILMILMAFSFGLLSMGIVLLIGKREATSKSILILGGVVIGYLFQAGVTALKYLSDDGALREITIWLMGGMRGATWKSIVLLLPVVIICFFYLHRQAVTFNALSGGDEVAQTLGIDVNKIRRNSLVVATLCTSACMAFTGIIGFVGLMSPHLCRMIVGNDQRYLLPTAALMGSVVLLISDTVSRIIISPIELPVGVLMYLIGGVFFIYLISSGNRGYSQ